MICIKKILISIENNSLKISYKNHRKVREDLINTNIVSDNELIFGVDYLENNAKMVSLFLKELCGMRNLSQVIFDNNEIAFFMLPFFQNINNITSLIIKSDENMTYAICERIIASKYINKINCYNIPEFMIEKLDQEYINVETRSEFFYISNFMQDNNLIHYSKIYYRNFVKINLPMTEEDKADFITFIKINRYLKVIRLSDYNKKELEFIISSLKEYRIKNVVIQIPGHNIKDRDVEYLKDLNKSIKEKRLKCTLSYSDDYLKDNIFKQIIINTIKICGLLIFILIGSVMAYVGTRNYISMRKVDSIQENIENILNSIEEEPKYETPPIESPTETPTESEEQIIKNKYITSLLSVNEDIVGWLKVNDTKVDYPVVKASDNDFYLKNNLYKEQDINGWIYMDYRNDEKELQQNTIIYGHNMYYSGVMFGTLNKAANKSWYENKENLIISFNTMYESMEWEIFSIYKINKTSDYLVNEFATQDDFLEYIQKISARSINDFQVSIKPNDKILTLSTCTGENQRFVIHAKLKTEKS